MLMKNRMKYVIKTICKSVQIYTILDLDKIMSKCREYVTEMIIMLMKKKIKYSQKRFSTFTLYRFIQNHNQIISAKEFE